MAEKRKISLVLSDVDGTLVTSEKVLTPRAQAAVRGLHNAGIGFAITSSRPPLGMAMLIEPLALDTPVGGFNGGVFVRPDLTVMEQRTLPEDTVRDALALIRQHGLDIWMFRGNDWLVTQPEAPHVAREMRAVRFAPRVVANFDGMLHDVAKIVGVSDDYDQVARCEAAAQAEFGTRVSANRSQSYYLDITHQDANKGAVLTWLSQHLRVPAEEIATIGDGANDVLMFRRSGFSIAMGNASDAVKAQAKAVTDSCDDDGFAKAMERIVLGWPAGVA